MIENVIRHETSERERVKQQFIQGSIPTGEATEVYKNYKQIGLNSPGTIGLYNCLTDVLSAEQGLLSSYSQGQFEVNDLLLNCVCSVISWIVLGSAFITFPH